jgi:hypothetical protein
MISFTRVDEESGARTRVRVPVDDDGVVQLATELNRARADVQKLVCRLFCACACAN